MSDTLTIRAARPWESAGLTALAHRAKASRGYPPEWLAAWDKDLTLSRDYLALHRAFVAERDQSIVGMVVLEAHATHWTLEHAWVEPHAQGTGVGRALVERALAVAWHERRHAVRLASDPGAVPFYARLGAVEVGSIAAPMPGAADRVLPIMEFTPA